jgi:Putative addiction module component
MLAQVLDRCSHSVNYSGMSLTSIQVKQIEAKWAAESEERIDAVERGELQTLDGPSSLQELRSSPQ